MDVIDTYRLNWIERNILEYCTDRLRKSHKYRKSLRKYIKSRLVYGVDWDEIIHEFS